ncbi:MAG: ribonuclease III [Coriobacteriia bacterium]
MEPDRTAAAERILGHRFSDPDLLRTALTHPSYAAENVDADTYDRLEFLGDAVLGFIVADHVYREFPDAPEGVLTRRKHHAVSRDALASAAEQMGLANLVLLGAGAHASGERQRASVLENTVEALIAALYMDGGLDVARGFVLRILQERLRGHAAGAPDVKGALQEWSQSSSKTLPAYRIVSAEGPPHHRRFTAEVRIGDTVYGTGEGPTKQAAEKAAATAALLAVGALPGDLPTPG